MTKDIAVRADAAYIDIATRAMDPGHTPTTPIAIIRQIANAPRTYGAGAAEQARAWLAEKAIEDK